MIAVTAYREPRTKHYFVKNTFGLWCHDGLGWFPYNITLRPKVLERVSWLELLLYTGVAKGQASDINQHSIAERYDTIACV